MRIDKWLWQARFYKTRSLATAQVRAGHVRLNGAHVSKPSAAVTAGDQLSFPQGTRIRIVRVTGLPARRGPAPEAQGFYDDLTPAAPPERAPEAARKGRPTKRERRQIDALRRVSLDPPLE